MSDTTIIRNSGLALQVCSDETDESVLTDEVNQLEPAGTTNGWILDKEPKNPNGGTDPYRVACADRENYYHYVFVC